MSQNSSKLGRRVFRKRLQEGPQLRSRKATVVHALKEHDPVARIHLVIGFCCLYTMEFIHSKRFFSNDGWFSLGGEMNSKNGRYSRAQNLGLVH
jgi:hypothetical protein